MLVQFFEMSSVGGSEDLYRFKSHVNHWLEKESDKIHIHFVKQNVVEKQGAIVSIISVWYEPKEKGVLPADDEPESTQKAQRVSFPSL
ncbi:MAG TPA: hypothetical protein PKH07_04675 [bacterium]|nr:hypothetical protein [bacterium]